MKTIAETVAPVLDPQAYIDTLGPGSFNGDEEAAAWNGYVAARDQLIPLIAEMEKWVYCEHRSVLSRKLVAILKGKSG